MQFLENLVADGYVFFLVIFFNAITFYIVAWITEKYPPKYPSKIYGYRTKQSYKSKAHWDFAQEQSIGYSRNLAHFFLIVSLIGYYIPLSEALSTIMMFIVMLGGIAWMFFGIENAIKNKFPE